MPDVLRILRNNDHQVSVVVGYVSRQYYTAGDEKAIG